MKYRDDEDIWSMTGAEEFALYAKREEAQRAALVLCKKCRHNSEGCCLRFEVREPLPSGGWGSTLVRHARAPDAPCGPDGKLFVREPVISRVIVHLLFALTLLGVLILVFGFSAVAALMLTGAHAIARWVLSEVEGGLSDTALGALVLAVILLVGVPIWWKGLRQWIDTPDDDDQRRRGQ